MLGTERPAARPPKTNGEHNHYTADRAPSLADLQARPEQRLLGLLLRDDRDIDKEYIFDSLSPAALWYSERLIYQAIRTIHAAGEPPLPEEVAKQLEKGGLLEDAGGAGYLIELLEAPIDSDPWHVDYLITKIRERHFAEQFPEKCRELAEAAERQGTLPADLTDGFDDLRQLFHDATGSRDQKPESPSLAGITANGPAWPDELDDAAYHGLAGDLIRTIEPHTEADPSGILAQFLAAFGSVIGRTGHFRAEADRHFGNIRTTARTDRRSEAMTPPPRETSLICQQTPRPTGTTASCQISMRCGGGGHPRYEGAID